MWTDTRNWDAGKAPHLESIRGGLIQEVRSTNPYTTVYIADYDAGHEDPDEEARLCDAEERGNQPDMHVVY